MHLDILAPIKVLSLTTQQEVHDPINAIKRINKFSWTIAKLLKLYLVIILRKSIPSKFKVRISRSQFAIC